MMRARLREEVKQGKISTCDAHRASRCTRRKKQAHYAHVEDSFLPHVLGARLQGGMKVTHRPKASHTHHIPGGMVLTHA